MNHRKLRSLSSGRKALLVMVVTIAVGSLFSANPILSLTCVLVLGLIWYNVLKSPYKTIMAAYLTFQWVQITMVVWMANLYRADLSSNQLVALLPSDRVLQIIDTTDQAVLLGLSAISLISLGFRVTLGFRSNSKVLEVPFRLSALFAGYLILLAVNLFAGPAIGGGLAQAIIALGDLKYLFAALLIYRWILHREGNQFVFAVIAIEVVIGFSGYFAEFKQIFLVAGVALLTLAPLRWKRVFPLLVGGLAIALVLGIGWTSVKGSYRSALNQGDSNQAVTLGVAERWETLQTLAAAQSLDSMGESAISMMDRLSYVKFLAIVLNRIPDIQPHEGGEVWGAAVSHVLLPRIFFADKPSLSSDSELTMRFTGLNLASGGEGTSISIGYVGDSYIDFGVIGACLCFFLLGLLYGATTSLVVRQFSKDESSAAVGCVVVLLMQVSLFETSSIKLLGGYLSSFIITFGFAAIIWPRIRSTMRVISRKQRTMRVISRNHRI